MTAADVTGWLDRLEETHKAATPGVWEETSPRVDGGAYIDTARVRLGDGSAPWVGHTHRHADAAAIVAAHNALPQLVAAVRGVLALADDLETTADSRQVLALDAEAAGASEESIFLRDRADDERAQADRIRSAVTAALDGAR